MTQIAGGETGDFKMDDSTDPHLSRSWSSHFLKLHAQLEVRDLLFTVKTKSGPRTLVDRLSLQLKSGDILAMMGPSGAGKTTVLDLMTMKVSGKKASGSVKLNGEPMTEKLFRSHCAMCEQYDTHWAFLTCQEIMNYTAKLCVADPKERKERLEAIMEHLGLLECANAKAGNAFLKGMSGGQRKRLSLGMALLKGPTVLFLDEPTSGLDAASTKNCMEYLESFAEEAKMIVIATIHQPSTEVFLGFTKVLFLCNGRPAFFGAPQEVAAYCNNIGYPLPKLTNPADFFIQIVNSEFVGREQADEIVGLWISKLKEDPNAMGFVTAKQEVEKLSHWHHHPGVCSQFCTLLRRHSLLSIRDPTLYVGRMVVFFVSNLVFSIVYIEARERHNKYAQARFFLTLWFGSATTMFSVVVVYAVNEEFNIVKRDLHNGIYDTSAYMLAKLCIQLPFMVLLAVFALLVPAYAVAAFNIDGILMYHVVMTLTILCYETAGEFLGLAIANPLIGMLGMILFWFTSFLFGGYFLSPDFIIWPLRIMHYTFPLGWAVRSLVYIETHGTTYDGAEEVSGGFYCPDLTVMECFGYTGDQVRSSLSLQFGVLSKEDTIASDIVYLVVIAVFWKMLACVMMIVTTLWVTPLHPIQSEIQAEMEEVKEVKAETKEVTTDTDI